MFITISLKKTYVILLIIILTVTSILATRFYYMSVPSVSELAAEEAKKSDYIKWVQFDVPYKALDKAMNMDIKSQEQEVKLNWIELLAYTATINYGNWKTYKPKQLDAIAKRLQDGEKMVDITKDMKYYNYYLEAYTAVLAEFLGSYKIEVKDETAPEGKVWQEKYGLKLFSPLAKGYYFSHYDDFGNSRDYGYKRKHLGNDLMGQTGSPIIAVEGGTIEGLGWNMYGGWRIGIRSFDKKRYYYYAHLRQNFPYNKNLKQGDTVKAGDVIGYLGRSGYSTRENTNNIKVPHLHFGLQLIFDEVQKEGTNQIWVDVYQLIELLQKNRVEVVKNMETKEYSRVYNYEDVKKGQ